MLLQSFPLQLYVCLLKNPVSFSSIYLFSCFKKKTTFTLLLQIHRSCSWVNVKTRISLYLLSYFYDAEEREENKIKISVTTRSLLSSDKTCQDTSTYQQIPNQVPAIFRQNTPGYFHIPADPINPISERRRELKKCQVASFFSV